MSYTAENLPEYIMKDLLDDNWKAYDETPKPQLFISNDPENAISMFNLNEGDAVVIYGEPEQIKGRGNLTYYDRIMTLGMDVYTKESRQRLRDLSKMIRDMVWINKHSFTGWQLIKPAGYVELVNEQLNIWRAEIKISLENHAITIATSL